MELIKFGSPIIQVPSKMLVLNKRGELKEIKTLTKSGDLKNYHGLRSIKFKKNGEVNDVIVKDKGLMAVKQKKQKTYNLASLFDEKPKKKRNKKK
jgi:hypothetical protein